jgi:hypothetical protein
MGALLRLPAEQVPGVLDLVRVVEPDDGRLPGDVGELEVGRIRRLRGVGQTEGQHRRRRQTAELAQESSHECLRARR